METGLNKLKFLSQIQRKKTLCVSTWGEKFFSLFIFFTLIGKSKNICLTQTIIQDNNDINSLSRLH